MSLQTNNVSSGAADALYSKIAWHIMPIMLLAYIVNYVDRINVGFAKLQMLSDLKFSESIYGLGAGIFFLGYFLFEVPSNLFLHKVGARVWICRVLITWGIVSGCTALVRTPWEFYTARCRLGIAESGFFPGMILYLTYWFPSHRRGQMVAILLTGSAIAGIVGGPVSGYIMRYLSPAAHVSPDGNGSSSSKRFPRSCLASSFFSYSTIASSKRNGSHPKRNPQSPPKSTRKRAVKHSLTPSLPSSLKSPHLAYGRHLLRH